MIKKVEFILFLIKTYYNNYFNSFIREQRKDPKKIPIIIISFNQLFYLKQLVNFLKKHNYSNIVIIDNNSTYPPLLDYFDSIESSVTLHRLNENLGHLVFWENKELFKMYSKGYYVITDADIVPVENCPDDFVQHFKKILDKNSTITKVGFSLKIDDIPDSNKNKKQVINWESQYWKFKNWDGNFSSDIDTTFALYRPNFSRTSLTEFLKAIRVDEPMIARHGGWYIDFNKLTEEQLYYISSANNSSSWLSDIRGELINPDFQKAYKYI